VRGYARGPSLAAPLDLGLDLGSGGCYQQRRVHWRSCKSTRVGPWTIGEKVGRLRRVTDAPHPPTDHDEELSPEEAARFIRRYHLGAVAEGSAHLESVLRSIFSSLLGSPRASVVAAGQSVSWLAESALAVRGRAAIT
jgi:hypothetical protein